MVRRRLAPLVALALVALGAPAHASSVSPAVFRAAVEGPDVHRALQACYDAARARDPGAAGRVVVRYSVARDGRVGAVEIGESALDEAANACIAAVFSGVVQRGRLPAPVRVVYPLVFQPPA